jgi:hypothetical protein
MPLWKRIAVRVMALLIMAGILYGWYSYSMRARAEWERIEKTSAETESVLIKSENGFDVYMIVFRGDTSVVAVKKINGNSVAAI